MPVKLITRIAILLALAEVLLVLLSWILSATMTEGVHSMLTSEGIRWFMSQFVAIVQKPLLVWLLLLSMAVGSLQRSFLPPTVSERHTRAGWVMALLALLAYATVLLLLTITPHAVLLSSTGSLFPSPFSRAFMPIVAFGMVLAAIANGFTTRTFRSATDVFSSFSYGIALAAPLFVVYILLIQFYESLRFVFG